ncbi:MAG: plasma-membrane proton-efflux P-type ATPase [Rubrobacteraceae bacterium]|nr:plasma-membrane proton-efflux P-type ATPase [Rubrobacteraceae bacterium]
MQPAKSIGNPAGERTGPGRPEEIERTPTAELFEKLGSSREGLTEQEARTRLERYGPNSLEEERRNILLELLSYFWGPIPWMIEVAAILSAAVRHWADLIIILVLLIFNAAVGFWQEYQATNAVEALKKQLALKARVLRDGEWTEIEASRLVPGDIVRLRIGDVVPADVKLLEGEYLSVDQSALTGESLPVDKRAGGAAYSGSTVKQGEMVALVVGTGQQTYFGKTARLVSSARTVSHFQRAVLQVGDFLIAVALALVAVLIIAELFRGAPFLTLVQFALILTVASIPVAMPAVLSVTMATGALALSRMKAIVSRLEAIEEMAGMDVLCSDKTGTLTQNRLTLGDPVLFGARDEREIVLMAALASTRDGQDPIDLAVLSGLQAGGSELDSYAIRRFVPFNPVDKRTEAEVEDPSGTVLKVTKGAPQVIIDLCKPTPELRAKANVQVDELAAQGFRTLGVARSPDGERWEFLGLLPLFDPPREDSAETLERAREHGIRVKMVTGDNMAIAREISSRLGLGTNIERSTLLEKVSKSVPPPADAIEQVEAADGFAEVFPEHKFALVKALQERGHIVGMTGDGVNDAPALKQADTGIAVSGATDAARAAADLVLTEAGLSVIVRAVEEARRIFERMNSYTIYRITMTLNIMLFVVATMLAFDFYPLTTVMIILLALLDDVPIMAIAFDNTRLDPRPVRWRMARMLVLSSVLGATALIQSFSLLLIARHFLHLGIGQTQSLLFLQLVIGGHLMLFLTRSKGRFWSRPYPALPLFLAIVGTQIVAVALVGFGILVAAVPWRWILLVWVYDALWMLAVDRIKTYTYRVLEHEAKHHLRFLQGMQRSFHHHRAG